MNKQSDNTIFWMLDEVIAETNPMDWEQARVSSGRIIAKIGNPDYKHELVDPIDNVKGIMHQLDGRRFSSILDLTGWLTPSLRVYFPDLPIVDTFSLSRVRQVSSPRLENAGHIISMSREEIENKKKELDLSAPLIVDDTSFSGWTSRKTMDLWGLDPEKTTHAFLMGNVGTVGEDKGAVDTLRALGGAVIYDLEVHSPQHDSWHIKDLYQSSDLSMAIDISIEFKKILDEKGISSNDAREFIANDEVANVLFPERFSAQEIINLTREGRFALNNGFSLREGEIYARNPFLWASPYFHAHVDMRKLSEHRNELVSDLMDLSHIAGDKEGKREASIGVQREIERTRDMDRIEGNFSRGVERL